MVTVSIQEAADRLGISADTIRRRIRKGEMAGHQEPTPQGFRWRVEIANNDHSAGQENGRHQDDNNTTMVELVAILQAQVQAQGEELEARRREVQQLHVLLQQAQAQVLPAPKGNLPWWSRLWRR